MKNKIFLSTILFSALVLMIPGCSKLLDKQPVTQIVTKTDSTSFTADDAENSLLGVYTAEIGYSYGLEFNVLDRITNGDVWSDNCYAGGDNPDNIAIDLFKYNALNGNISRDWSDAYGIIATANITIAQVAASTDPALTQTRKNQILGEARFMRAFTYFDLVRLFGAIPLMLKPVDQTNSENLIKSTLIPRSGVDTIYDAILSDLWFARANVQDDNAPSTKMIVTKGAANAILAKVYASMPTPNWDSVAYYCDQVIPNYSLVANFNSLWDNSAKNNSEAIWEFNYVGWNVIGNWIPSQFIGDGWKKFETPTNDLVNVFRAEGDSVRLHASITFVNYGWADPYWKDVNNYPILSKYTDPNNGTNDFYAIRLSDILLLRAEAYNNSGNLPSAAALVNQVRTRVGLSATPAANQSDMALAIEKERRLELAFEGHRWFDLVRTGRAITVMNALKDGSGNNLNYNVQDYQLVYPVPQVQLDNNLLLTQNKGY
ncbi:MAG TPA: RagB/SusD family nutrient uptake outer membrane protein [Puia sp.]|nr:RagB/SusD family nutrient uptake outer membrane protein [Puia sp.]